MTVKKECLQLYLFKRTHPLKCCNADPAVYGDDGMSFINWEEYLVFADVNNGINTRPKLRRHDPQLAGLLEQAFGDREWRYQDTSPAKFQPYGVKRYPSLCSTFNAKWLLRLPLLKNDKIFRSMVRS